MINYCGNSRPLIPKKMSNNKLKIWKEVTLWDFIMLILFSSISFGVYVTTSVLDNILLRVFLAIFTFLILSIFICPMNSKGKRVYHFLKHFFHFQSSLKKYEFNEKNKTSSLLISYDQIVNDLTIQNHLIEGNKEYIQGFKINGFDLFNLSLDTQNRNLNNLMSLFVEIESTISIIKVDESLNLDNYQTFLLKERENISKKKEFNKKQKDSRIETIEEIIEEFQDGGLLDQNQGEKCFYLLIYNNDLKILNQELFTSMNKCKMGGLKTKQLTAVELMNLFKTIIEPSDFKFDNNYFVDENKNKLDQILSLQNVEFKASCFKIKDDFYRNISIVDSWPTFPNRGWLCSFMNSEATVVLNIATPKSKKFEKQLNKTIQNVETNLIGINQKNYTDIRKLENDLDIYQEVVNSVGTGNEKFKKINAYAMLSAYSFNELKTKQKEFGLFLKEEDITLDPLTFRQKEAFSGLLPKLFDPLAEEFEHITTASTLAEGFPFISQKINEDGGILIGKTHLGEVVILDQYKNLKNTDPTRKNANAVIMGQAGSGKTTAVTTFIHQHLALGRRGYIIDPEGEYKQLIDIFDGQWLEAGTGRGCRINPLQIMALLNDDEKNISKNLEERNKTLIATHLIFLESFFKVLYSQNTDEENRYLIKMIGLHYETNGFLYKNLNTLQNND